MTHIPHDGDWPCQKRPATDAEVPPRLVAFLYRVLRDGVDAPSHAEEHAIQAAMHIDHPYCTNSYLEGYARALAAHLLTDERESSRSGAIEELLNLILVEMSAATNRDLAADGGVGDEERHVWRKIEQKAREIAGGDE